MSLLGVYIGFEQCCSSKERIRHQATVCLCLLSLNDTQVVWWWMCGIFSLLALIRQGQDKGAAGHIAVTVQTWLSAYFKAHHSCCNCIWAQLAMWSSIVALAASSNDLDANIYLEIKLAAAFVWNKECLIFRTLKVRVHYYLYKVGWNVI